MFWLYCIPFSLSILENGKIIVTVGLGCRVVERGYGGPCCSSTVISVLIRRHYTPADDANFGNIGSRGSRLGSLRIDLPVPELMVATRADQSQPKALKLHTRLHTEGLRVDNAVDQRHSKQIHDYAT